ncbi:MAG TPA: adenosine deaminase [Candidatus Eremiobacteraceae bacterium]
MTQRTSRDVSDKSDNIDISHDVDLRSWIVALPKPELHVHLEGTMLPQTYARIARRNGLDIVDDPDTLYRHSDFNSFLRSFLTMVGALKTPQDFAEVTSEYLTLAAKDGIRHVELFVSPATQRKFVPDLDYVAVIRAINNAAIQAQRDSGISTLLLIDMVRNLGEDEAMLDVALAHNCRDLGVVGIGLGGDEARFPARDFQNAFKKAEELGLRRTAHAGEAAGPQSIIDAVELLHAERIGHGVAARASEDVQKLLRERNVTLDACLTSNEFTGAVEEANNHPLKEWLAANVSVSLSSDDPAFFKASVSDEYMKAAMLGLDRKQLAAIARNGFAASFAGGERIRAWCDELDDYVARTGLPAS